MGDQVRLHIEQLGLEVTVRQVGPAVGAAVEHPGGEAVGRIAGGIAHELNNVLTAIAGYNELILSRMSESNPLRRDAAEIERAVERASALARQLLAIAGRQVFEMKLVDVNALVAAIEPRLRELGGPGVAVDLVLAPAAPRAFASRELIEEALLLLAESAIGAMGGAGALRIATSSVPPADDAPSGLVLVELADTGPAPSGDPERIFEPFAAEPPARGSGLALAAARGMILQNGGRLDVKAAPGLTTLVVSLAAAGGAPQLAEPGGSERQTVLVAEDVDVIRTMVCESLERRGYRVLSARDGREALALAAAYAGTIELLLTDVAMPGLDGVALAQALRETRPAIRVLYMSGSPAEHVARDLELAPGTGFIAKPITPSSLALRVRQALAEGLSAPGR